MTNLVSMHFRRRPLPGINDLREEWMELGFRATADSESGFILVAVRDDEPDAWPEIEIGTAQVDELIGLLRDAHQRAKGSACRRVAHA